MTLQHPERFDDFAESYAGAKRGLFTRFLWWCAGADARILQFCPSSDHVKYQGIGGVVFSTGVLAFLSGSYAFYTVFGSAVANSGHEINDPYIWLKATLAGFVWAAVIFNIDRFIVSSTGYGDGTDKVTARELLNASPRIAMACIIGFCLSKPLEVRVFQSEIEGQLALEQAQHAEVERVRRVGEITVEQNQATRDFDARLNSEKIILANREAAAVQAQRVLDAQVAIVGRETMGDPGSSGHPGDGPRAHALRAEQERLEHAVVDAHNSAEEARTGVHAIETQQMAALAEYGRRKDAAGQATRDEARVQVRDGLLRRIQLAHHLSPAGTWALTLLLLMIEVGPIFFKLMIIKSTYDYLYEDLKEFLIARAGIDQHAVRHVDEAGSAVVQTLHFRADREIAVRRAAMEQEKELGQQVVAERGKAIAADIPKNIDNYLVSSEEKRG